MNAPDDEARLRARYLQRASVSTPPTVTRRVLAIPATSPHRRGWLPWPMLGGLQAMLSATKMVAAVAVIGLFSILLAGAASGPANETRPAAAELAGRDMMPRAVSGTVVDAPLTPSWEVDPEYVGQDRFQWTAERGSQAWEASDPRLSGTGRYAEGGLQHLPTYTGLRSTAWTITNEAGSWTGHGNAFVTPTSNHDFVVLTGAGAYEGLTAYVAIGSPEGWSSVTAPPSETSGVRPFEAIIMLGDSPAMPPLPSQ